MIKRLTPIILVLIAGFIAWRLMSNTNPASPPPTATPAASPTTSATEAPSTECQNPSLNLAANEEVSFPLKVVMVVDNREPACRWTIFEAQAGTIEIRDQANQLISQGLLTTTDEWMTEQPVEYQATLTQTTQTTSGKIRLIVTEDDPSGMRTPRQIEIPLRISVK